MNMCFLVLVNLYELKSIKKDKRSAAEEEQAKRAERMAKRKAEEHQAKRDEEIAKQKRPRSTIRLIAGYVSNC